MKRKRIKRERGKMGNTITYVNNGNATAVIVSNHKIEANEIFMNPKTEKL